MQEMHQSLGSEGNVNPLQHSCLEQPMDRVAWQAIVHRVAKRQTQLSTSTHRLSCGTQDLQSPLWYVGSCVAAYRLFSCGMWDLIP